MSVLMHSFVRFAAFATFCRPRGVTESRDVH